MATIQDLFNAMANMEGWNVTGSVAQRNNNPLNLMYAGQVGATLGANGFAVFDSVADGTQAGLNQIGLNASRGQTLSEFLNIFAPPSTNNTNSYINYVSAQTGISPDDTLLSVLGDSVNPHLPHHHQS